MSDEPPVIDDTSLAGTGLVDAGEVRRAMEYYAARGWTDGLPVVPVTASYLEEFLATTARDPDEVLIPMPHLNKALTVRLAAINAALAGCLPEYFPVVLAAWDAFMEDGMVSQVDLAVDHGHGAVLRAVRAAADRRSGSTRAATCGGRGSGPTPRPAGPSGSARSTASG